MKKIPHIDLPGAKRLTPLEMNKIHFETGQHSPLPDKATSTEQANVTSESGK